MARSQCLRNMLACSKSMATQHAYLYILPPRVCYVCIGVQVPTSVGLLAHTWAFLALFDKLPWPGCLGEHTETHTLANNVRLLCAKSAKL